MRPAFSLKRLIRLEFALVTLGLLTSTCHGHELPFGEVRRDAQLVVFPDRIEVQYQVVTGTATMLNAIGEEQGHADRARPEWDRYREQLLPQIAESLHLTVNGRKLDLEPNSSETEQRHHTSLRFVFSAKFNATSERQELVLVDRNFNEAGGIHRVAVKGRRGVQLEQATQPPTVSRVERRPWRELTRSERQQATCVECRFLKAEGRTQTAE